MTRKQRVASVVLLCLAFASAGLAQTPQASATATPAADVTGTWQGTLLAGPTTLRIGLLVTKSEGGPLTATLVIIDQDGARVPVQLVTVTGWMVHMDIPAARGTYDGVIDASGRAITGTLTQGMPTSLNFTRVEKLDTPPVFSEKENADVRALVAEYFRAFTAKDFDAFRAVFQPPYMMWSVGSSPNTFTTLDDIVARYRTLRQSLDATEYAVSKAAQMIVTPLSPNTAMVDVHWRRDKKDGSLFNEGGEILMVIRTSSGWKINANLNRQLSRYGKTF